MIGIVYASIPQYTKALFFSLLYFAVYVHWIQNPNIERNARQLVVINGKFQNWIQHVSEPKNKNTQTGYIETSHHSERRKNVFHTPRSFLKRRCMMKRGLYSQTQSRVLQTSFELFKKKTKRKNKRATAFFFLTSIQDLRIPSLTNSLMFSNLFKPFSQHLYGFPANDNNPRQSTVAQPRTSLNLLQPPPPTLVKLTHASNGFRLVT